MTILELKAFIAGIEHGIHAAPSPEQWRAIKDAIDRTHETIPAFIPATVPTFPAPCPTVPCAPWRLNEVIC